MRDMDNSPNNEIKLFGTTITIHDRKQQKHTHTSDNDTTQQTGEMKRPDKIIPCPRCKSMDTKFCYFNNYNVNQPRHFCKGCQRYWTAGGSIRNVPVGAGRRKHKTIPSGTGFSDISCGLYDANPSAVQHYFNLQGAVGWKTAGTS